MSADVCCYSAVALCHVGRRVLLFNRCAVPSIDRHVLLLGRSCRVLRTTSHTAPLSPHCARRPVRPVMARRRYDIVLHMFDEQDMLPRVDPRNVVTAEVHVWIHVELITPLGAELHVIDLDAEEDDETEGVEAEGVDQGAEDVQAESAADEAHVEDDENAMHDECDSVRGDRQTNEDEDDWLMSGYSSDDAPLDAVSENESDADEDENEDDDESEDPMKNYLHRDMYEGLREKIIKYTFNKLYRAKKKALEQIDGSYGDSYSRLPHYAEMVRRSNHGSIVKLQYNHDENDDELVSSIPIVLHSRVFVGLDALRKAIGLDVNNGLFPLAFVVVESECKDSWCFFFQALDEMLGGFDVDRPWTFMSDRQKGLLDASMIWYHMQSIGGEFRGKPIMTLLEGVRTKVMSMVHKRHEKGLKWTKEIMPNILKKANEQMEWSRHCNLHVASQTEFEVLDKNKQKVQTIPNIKYRNAEEMPYIPQPPPSQPGSQAGLDDIRADLADNTE
ncbi:UNVERIFIED_CONTAM: hypothetical protein Sradi_3227800 [Sesamum radiatum]|uniref:MULE transposase domain-containing protein n=1 Tax=Sesamum radiatum TaxID=300843 RepID=A0AAW2RHA8_SESRA